MCSKKVLCKDCKRWYETKVDQCDIPTCGIELIYNTKEFPNHDVINLRDQKNININFLVAKGEVDFDKIQFIRGHLDFLHLNNHKGNLTIYGHPSKLNLCNDCPFFIDKNPPKKMTFWEWLKIQLS
jgi:hypothetical protein